VSAQEDLLEQLFARIASGDVDAVAELYADDVEVWNTVSLRAMQREESLAVLRSFLRRADAVRYEVLERRQWEGGAMQRHVLHVRVREQDHRIDVCVTFAFADGCIRRIYEYVDSRALAPLGW
jgi:ketosteroid isomerase-like protein